MLNPIKIPPHIQVAVAADFHLGHDKGFLYKKRGFANIQDHDDWILNELSLLATSSPTILFDLGDACLLTKQRENFEKLSLIPFKEHFFIWGNHNAGAKDAYAEILSSQHGLNSAISQLYPVKYNNLTFVGDTMYFKLGKQFFFCSHFSHFIWDRSHHGVIHLCGHSHGSCKQLNANCCDNGKVFDCGVENAIKHNGLPYFMLDDIISIIGKKPIIQRDHHDANTN